MFLISWARTLAAFPFSVVGTALALFNVPLAAPVLHLAWHIGRSERIGHMALGRTFTLQGPQAAKALANQWLQRHPSPGVAAMAGVYALAADDVEACRAFFVQGRRLGDDPNGLLDYIELTLAGSSADPAATEAVLARFESRRDLAPLTSKSIVIHRMWQEMLAGRFDEAEARAEHALQVDHLQEAEVVLWALATLRGDGGTAESHLRKAHGPDDSKVYAQALCNVAIGRLDEAARGVATIAERHPSDVARIQRLIAQRGGLA